jgi:hypothetical protein
MGLIFQYIITNIHTKLDVYALLQIIITHVFASRHLLLGNELIIRSVARVNASWNTSKRASVHEFAWLNTSATRCGHSENYIVEPCMSVIPKRRGNSDATLRLVLTATMKGVCLAVCSLRITTPLHVLRQSLAWQYRVHSMDTVPDSLILRKSSSAGNGTRDLWIFSQKLWPLDDRGGQNINDSF